MTNSSMRSARLPWDELAGGEISRHRHVQAYAAVVLAGRYEEAGDAGRFQVREGDVLLHRPFEAHRNVVAPEGAIVLNVPLPDHGAFPSAFRIPDPDDFRRMARSDPECAHDLLVPVTVIQPEVADWPDLLAADLRGATPVFLKDWARNAGLDPATVSRGFKRVFGVSPARYRAEHRTRVAIDAIRRTRETLASIAMGAGFADQAHMTRAVQTVASMTPAQLRNVNFVQD